MTSGNNYLRILPLYDTLVEKLTTKINQENFFITDEYKNRLKFVLSNLDPSRANQVALLLIHYYFLTHPNSNPFTLENCSMKSASRNSISNLPYDIKISSSGTGLSFDFNDDKVPPPLQVLLGVYCCI